MTAAFTPKAQIDRAIRLAYGRTATPEEEQLLTGSSRSRCRFSSRDSPTRRTGRSTVRPLTGDNAGMLEALRHEGGSRNQGG